MSSSLSSRRQPIDGGDGVHGTNGKRGAFHDVFDRVYCINLDRSTDRWVRHCKHFAEFGLKSERFAATDGNGSERACDGTAAEGGGGAGGGTTVLEAARAAGVVHATEAAVHATEAAAHFTQSPGAIGIAWTSYRLWQRIARDATAENADKWILIVEDDVHLHPTLVDDTFVRYLWSRVPADADLVQLGYNMRHTKTDMALHVQSVNPHVWRIVHRCTGAYAYAIRYRTAEVLIREHVPFRLPVDYFNVDRMNVYALKALRTEAFGTDEALRVRDGNTWLGGLVGVMGGPSTILPPAEHAHTYEHEPEQPEKQAREPEQTETTPKHQRERERTGTPKSTPKESGGSGGRFMKERSTRKEAKDDAVVVVKTRDECVNGTEAAATKVFVDLTAKKKKMAAVRGPLHAVFGDRIYCINLDRSPDRWAAQKEQFEHRLLVSVERVAAIDGKNTPTLVDDALRDGIIATDADFLVMDDGRKRGVTALLVTTVRLWRRIAALPGPGDPWCLICEDDVHLDDACARDAAWVNYVRTQVPHDAAMVLLGFTLHYGHHIRHESDVTAFVKDVNTAVCRVIRPVCGAHSYALKRSTAATLLESCLPFRRALDMAFPVTEIPVYALRTPGSWSGGRERRDELRQHYGVAGIMPFDSTINAQRYSEQKVTAKQANNSTGLDKFTGEMKGAKTPCDAAQIAHRAAVYAHHHLTDGGAHHASAAFALLARTLGDRSWRNDDEIAVCGYWIGAYEEACRASFRELDNGALPKNERCRVAKNLAFAQRKLGHVPRAAAATAKTMTMPLPRYVTVALRNGLGNQMFIVAAAHAYARRTGRQLLLHALPVEVHNATPRPTYWTSVMHRLRAYGEQWWLPPPPHMEQPPRVYTETRFAYDAIPPAEDAPHVHLHGFFQSAQYSGDEERALFAPSESVQKEVDALYAKYTAQAPPGKVLVAVHVRRGDFVHNPKQFPPLPLSYYERALEQFDTESVALLVFSDDMTAARHLLAPLGRSPVDSETDSETGAGTGDGRGTKTSTGTEAQQTDPGPAARSDKRTPVPIVYVDESMASMPDYVQMYLMARCEGGHIIANSTFSWWAANLSRTCRPGSGTSTDADPGSSSRRRRRVVMPKPWFGPEGPSEHSLLCGGDGDDCWTEVEWKRSGGTM